MKKTAIVFLWIITVTLSASAKLTMSQQNFTMAEYSVQSGDTLYIIAKKHHTTVAEVLKANGLELGSVIRVGQRLRVPLNTYFPSEVSDNSKDTKDKDTEKTADTITTEYTVKKGDSFFTIARKHHTTIAELLERNNMNRTSVIRVGQKLIVPLNTYFPEKQKQTAPIQELSSSQTIVSANQKNTYIVKAGDTLFSVARKNHIVISKLMKYNNIGLGDTLRVGQVLKVSANGTYVPGKVLTQPKSGAQIRKQKAENTLPVGAMPSYTVKKGDTLWGIAQKYHLTLAEIRKLNKMKKSDQIHTGMVLAVGKAIKQKPKTYTVKKGDTLWLIAKKHNMSTEKLRKLNHLQRQDHIRVGMVLSLSTDKISSVSGQRKVVSVKNLKKKGANTSEIEAVMARTKASKKSQKNIDDVLANRKEKKQKQARSTVQTKQKKKKRYESASAMLNGKTESRSSKNAANNKTIRIAKRYLGRRYVWGAEGPSAFDCSGFTQYVIRKSKGIRLPRVSRKQAYYGKYVSRKNLRPGDLIFFDTSRRRRGYVNHVGIYIGNNKFIHASSARHRVVITSLDRPFYRARFKWGRRVN